LHTLFFYKSINFLYILATFEYFDAEMPKEEDVAANIQAAAEIEYSWDEPVTVIFINML